VPGEKGEKSEKKNKIKQRKGNAKTTRPKARKPGQKQIAASSSEA